MIPTPEPRRKVSASAGKSKRRDSRMKPRELLSASRTKSRGPLKKRFKGNQTTSESMLEHIKLDIQKMDPNLDPESPEFRTAVIIMAATFVVGIATKTAKEYMQQFRLRIRRDRRTRMSATRFGSGLGSTTRYAAQRLRAKRN